jgi:hypothetical protein
MREAVALKDIEKKPSLMFDCGPLHRALVGRTGLAKDGDDDASPAQDSPAQDVRSKKEIAAAILAFTPAQKLKLSKAAHIYGGRHMQPDDLLQRAFHLALEDGSDKEQGRRCCPVHVDVVTFLCQVMRSIGHGEREKQRNRPPHLPINPNGLGATAVDPIDPGPDPGEMIDAVRTYRHVMSLFDHDPLAKAILEGIEMKLDSEEIRRRTGLTKVAYESKRRQIRRIIGRAYPKGLQS